jgi:hypothetical protein
MMKSNLLTEKCALVAEYHRERRYALKESRIRPGFIPSLFFVFFVP